MADLAGHGVLMDRVYRHQRHIYDATRKYYLLGRDPMLAGLMPPPDGHVLEIGCGTGRNIVAAARLYPGVSFHGIDISAAMLQTAARSVENAGLRDRVRLAHADATGFNPARTFGRHQFDRVFISYAVSMIPQWRQAIVDAAGCLSPGGELHIADFGDLAGWPRWSRTMLHAWLGLHHVTPRDDLFDFMADLAANTRTRLETRRLHGGYAWIAVLR